MSADPYRTPGSPGQTLDEQIDEQRRLVAAMNLANMSNDPKIRARRPKQLGEAQDRLIRLLNRKAKR